VLWSEGLQDLGCGPSKSAGNVSRRAVGRLPTLPGAERHIHQTNRLQGVRLAGFVRAPVQAWIGNVSAVGQLEWPGPMTTASGGSIWEKSKAHGRAHRGSVRAVISAEVAGDLRPGPAAL
jgi:hypothetical protein